MGITGYFFLWLQFIFCYNIMDIYHALLWPRKLSRDTFFSQFTFLEIYKGYSKSLKGMITTIVCATQVKRVIKIQLINIK